MTRHDKHVLPEWLEREIQDIDSIIGTLEAVKNSAFSLSSSPVDVLVKLLVDLLIKVKNSYEYGFPETETRNPAIIFDDDLPMGPLGNSSQRTVKFHSKLNWAPVYQDRDSSPMPKLLRALAVFFSRSLHSDFNFQKAFVQLLKDQKKFLPPGLAGQKSKNAEKNNKDLTNIRNSRYWYFRRRQ